jgi:hypothetical protein
MAKTPKEEQKEYNSLLELTQSMLGEIGNAMGNIGDISDKRNKKLAEQVDLTKEILKSVKTEKDAQLALEMIRENNKEISKQDFGVNNKLKDTFLQQEAALEGIVQAHKQSAKMLSTVDGIADGVKDKFDGILDGFMSDVKSIPIIGKPLASLFEPFKDKIQGQFGKVIGDFKGGFGKAFATARGNGMSFAKSITTGIGGGLKGAAGAARLFAGALLTPVGIAYMLYKAFSLGLERFKELDAAAQSFRENTGLLNSQTQGLQQTISSVSVEYANLGVTAADVANAAAEFTNAFDGLQQPAKETVESLVIMNKNFGVGFTEASKVNKVFQNMGGLSEAQAQSLSMSVVEMSKLANVAPQKVMQDIADNSGNALKYFRGSPSVLAKSAVSLAAMGSSLESAAKSSESLLDFESSIANELEASAMLGADINLEKARAAAFAGDQYGQEKAIMEQMMKLGDISKMDMYSKEALAKATGKEVDELINMQRIQKQFGNLDEGRLAAAHALMDAGKDITQITSADLDLQNKKMASQQQMQGQMDKLANASGVLGTALMDALAPLAKVLIPIATDLFDILNSLLMPALSTIGSALSIALVPLRVMWDLFMAISKPIFAIAGAIMQTISKPLATVSQKLEPFLAKFTELKDKIMEAITPVLPLFSAFGEILSVVIGGALDFLFVGFDAFFDMIFGAISAVSGFMQTYLVEPFMSFISTLQGAADFIVGLNPFGGGGGSEGTTQSVNDGVMQNGQVISTDPADFLIASKNPSALAGQLSGGGDGGATAALVNSLIAEMQGMRADLAAGKIAVNIDGQKMNAKIAANAVRNPIT